MIDVKLEDLIEQAQDSEEATGNFIAIDGVTITIDGRWRLSELKDFEILIEYLRGERK